MFGFGLIEELLATVYTQVKPSSLHGLPSPSSPLSQRQERGNRTGILRIRDIGLLESAIAQLQMTFGGEELYPNLLEKLATLGFSIIMNHPFIDGNKRTGHAVVEMFLVLNGMEISASVDEQERIVLAIGSGQLGREASVEWLKQYTFSYDKR